MRYVPKTLTWVKVSLTEPLGHRVTALHSREIKMETQLSTTTTTTSAVTAIATNTAQQAEDSLDRSRVRSPAGMPKGSMMISSRPSSRGLKDVYQEGDPHNLDPGVE